MLLNDPYRLFAPAPSCKDQKSHLGGPIKQIFVRKAAYQRRSCNEIGTESDQWNRPRSNPASKRNRESTCKPSQLC
jgi:hypothetical protein